MDSGAPLTEFAGHHVAPLVANGFQFALQETTLSGAIICGALFVLSCFGWAVMITKIRVLRKARRESELFLQLFRQSQTPLDLYTQEVKFNGAPLFNVYQSASRELAFQLLGSSEIDDTFEARLHRSGKLTPTQMDGVENAMVRSVGEMVLRLESQMAMLATTVSGAPFLGLLGTVWGVMDTFGGVAAAEGAASLKTMAPGVSAALVTTVVGLLVAIPAMFGYNAIVNSIKRMVSQLDNFSAELSGTIRRRHLAHPGLATGWSEPGSAALPRLSEMGDPAPERVQDAPVSPPEADEENLGGGFFAPST